MRRKLLLFLSRLCSRTTRLRIELEETDRLYRKLIASEKRRNNQNKLQELYSDWGYESDLIEEELKLVETRRLVNKARRLLLPVPDIPTGKEEDGKWIRGPDSGRWYLKPEGFSEIRALIRGECKERREALMAWATIIIGIIGALTGLVAVWRR
jgi:hypothetical protein